MYNPQFIITNNILKAIAKIEASRAIIDYSKILPLYEREFKNEAQIRQVHYSTAIEGNFLDLSEVKRIVTNPESLDRVKSIDGYLEAIKDIEGNEIIARKRDIYEVINYRKAVKYIEDLAAKKRDGEEVLLTEEIIFNIHKILLDNIIDKNRGEYRDAKAISVNFLTGEKHSIYEEVENIPVKVRGLLRWYQSPESKDVHPILKAGILHVELIRVHPFVEGNGRVARAVATLCLSLEGYGINNFFCLDEYYDSEPSDYYSSLRKGFVNLSDWLEYFCTGMALEYNRVKERVIKISKDTRIKDRSGQVFVNARQGQIIEWINTYGFFRNQDFDVLFPDISEDTVLRELKYLVDNKLIVKKGKTKSSRYEFN